MVTYILDGNLMRTRDQAHEHIASVLSFPPHYGRNLDALWDCLGDFEGEIMLKNAENMLAALGSYGASLIKTLNDAESANPHIKFSIQSEHTEE